MTRALLAHGAVIVALLLPSLARASSDAAFELTLEGCEGVDRAELLSLLELELSDVTQTFRERGAPLVEVRCREGTLRVRIQDPVTGKAVARDVPLPPPDGIERSIALAVSQLYLSSWLELVLPLAVQPPMPERPREERAVVERRVREVLPRPAAASADLAVFGGAGVRDVESPMPTVLASVRARFAPSAEWMIVAALGIEHGVASRSRGDVALWLAHAELGAGVPVLREGPLTIDVSARAGVVWAQLAGRPSAGSVAGGSIAEVGARLVAGSSATLAFDWFTLALAVDVGADLHLPEGLVSGERSIVPGGPFAQVSLGVGVRFR